MANTNFYNILAQTNPSGTSAVTAYTKPTQYPVTIVGIAVCNTTNSNVTYSIYVSPTGTTYDTTTAIVYSYLLLANDSDFIEFPFTLNVNGGTIGVKSSSANAINYTIIGKINYTNTQ